MLPKSFRVAVDKIPFILRKGNKIESKFFIILFITNEEGHSRYRAIVSKKISKKAVVRNKLRRRIYNTLRLAPHEESNDYIVIPKKQTLNRSFKELSTDLWKTLKK